MEEVRTKRFTAIRCPMCGGPLERGYVVPVKGLAWAPRRMRVSLETGFEWLAAAPRLTLANFLARRCTDCKLILFRAP